MIRLASFHLAAEYIVRPRRIGEDERNDEERADKCEAHALCGRRRFADGDARRHDIRPKADRETAVAEEQQQECQREWCGLRLAVKHSEYGPGCRQHEDRHGREEKKVRQAEPTSGNVWMGERRPKADNANPIATVTVAKKCRPGPTLFQPNSMTPRKPASRKKAVSTS